MCTERLMPGCKPVKRGNAFVTASETGETGCYGRAVARRAAPAPRRSVQ
jgi:hypothetical protein